MCRIYGVYSISMYEGIEIKFMIMNNVFNTHLSMDDRYDLKGSWINRQAWKNDEKSGLGLDLDIQRPFDIGTSNAKSILNQLRSDSNVCASLSIYCCSSWQVAILWTIVCLLVCTTETSIHNSMKIHRCSIMAYWAQIVCKNFY